MDLNDLIMLAAAMIYSPRFKTTVDEIDRQLEREMAVREAKKLWSTVVALRDEE